VLASLEGLEYTITATAIRIQLESPLQKQDKKLYLLQGGGYWFTTEDGLPAPDLPTTLVIDW